MVYLLDYLVFSVDQLALILLLQFSHKLNSDFLLLQQLPLSIGLLGLYEHALRNFALFFSDFRVLSMKMLLSVLIFLNILMNLFENVLL